MINKNFDGLKAAIMSMVSGDECRIKTSSFQNDMVSFRSKDDILTLLVHLGYLAYNQKRQTAYIPNEEIRGEFANADTAEELAMGKEVTQEKYFWLESITIRRVRSISVRLRFIISKGERAVVLYDAVWQLFFLCLCMCLVTTVFLRICEISVKTWKTRKISAKIGKKKENCRLQGTVSSRNSV